MKPQRKPDLETESLRIWKTKKNSKEAKEYKSKLVRYIKSKYPKAEVKAKEMVFGRYDSFTTYIHTIGPCYHCSNINITVDDLEGFIVAQESSYSWQQKQRELEWKRERREMSKRRRNR